MDELLKLLRENAIEAPENLARMLGTSVEDVNGRIAAYQQQGINRGYQAIVNEDRLEMDRVRAVIEVRITPEREGGFNRVAERVSKFDEVESLYLMSGTYDLLVFVVGRDLKQVATFVAEKLATIEGVLSTSTHFMLKTYKDAGILMHAAAPAERLAVSP